MTSFFTKIIQKFDAVFYQLDPDRTGSASVSSGVETFDFSGGDSAIDVTVDGGAVQNLTILESWFANSAAALASEVVVGLDPLITGGEAYADANGQVIIATTTRGASGSILVAGAAVSILGYVVTTLSGSGYDDIFGAVKPVDDGTQEGTFPRREKAPVTLRCQLDWTGAGRIDIVAGGKEVPSDIVITVKSDDLVSLSLMDANNEPVLTAGDRLDKILRIDGVLERKFPNPEGMWITMAEPKGYGLAYFGTPQVNLYDFHCSKDRVVT